MNLRNVLALTATVLVFSCAVSRAQSPWSLTTSGSAVTVNNSQAGLSSWTVNGQNQLHQQWLWYRVGNDPQASIDTLTLSSWSQPDAGTLETTYSDLSSQFSLSIKYSLSGNSGNYLLGEQIVINNTSSLTMPLDFHLYQYSDFNLSGGNNTAQVVRDPFFGLFNEAIQQAGSSGFQAAVTVPGANHAEVGLTTDAGNTLSKLNGPSAVNLSDVTGPVTGDATWALQWDLSINKGTATTIGEQINLQVAAVPEPATLALISLGLACWVLPRRRK
jgi:hypothetical protein